MAWPYAFITLTDEERVLRSAAMARYAAIAHNSALAPLAILVVVRLVRIALARVGLSSSHDDGQGQYQEVPGSPVAKAQRVGASGGIASHWRKFKWWMSEDLYTGNVHWGRRDQWILGSVWTVWMLTVCVAGTGRDYLHLTKRFGIIAASQLPIQYLMALKFLNPFAWALRSSHEEINRYHRVLGRIVYALHLCHILFYNYFLIVSGFWLKRFFAPVVFCGVVASFGLHALNTTALARVRRLSYRLFFVVHLFVALAVPVLIFFHASSARPYVGAAMLLFLFDLATRKLTTVNASSSIENVPGTNLIKVVASMPSHKTAVFRASPGSHIYLSLPPSARTPAVVGSQSPLVNFLFNPFSVASVDEDNGSITFVARTRQGPMTNILAQFAAKSLPPTSSPSSSSNGSQVPLAIEGPYGAMAGNFQALLSYISGRILIIAGGIGATFAVPIYHALLNESPGARVQLVWAVRGASDATWAVTGDHAGSGKTLLDDENVHLFMTGDMGVSSDNDVDADDADDADNDAVEMRNLRHGESDRFTRRRPDMANIIDSVFRQDREAPIAVLVCGPAEMAKQAKASVRPWVMDHGRKVWFHDESFGW